MRKIGLLLLLSFVLSGCTLVPGQTSSTSNSSSSSSSQTLTQDGVTAELSYQGNNSWHYDVSTDLPTPCYTLEVQSTVAESFPEQVTIQAKIYVPDPAMMCVQVITPKQVSGTINASSSATFSLKVSR